MSFTGDRTPITTQHCSIRGCSNNAYILYPLEGMQKAPVCKDCLNKLMRSREDLSFKEWQLNKNFRGR